nr:unnamed protein product [Rangifer tarandus platyrhynchus]
MRAGEKLCGTRVAQLGAHWRSSPGGMKAREDHGERAREGSLRHPGGDGKRSCRSPGCVRNVVPAGVSLRLGGARSHASLRPLALMAEHSGRGRATQPRCMVSPTGSLLREVPSAQRS